MAETPAAEQGNTKEVLFRNPNFPNQPAIIVPGPKVSEYVEAGWERVKRDDEAEARETAVAAFETHKRHFGTSIVA